MLIVPLKSLKSQTVQVTLGNQNVQLKVYQKFFGLFMDVSANGSLIIAGVKCLNLNKIVRDLYLGFVGDFMFIDNEGSSDPDYTGLGSRFSLAYLELSDLGGTG